MTFEQTLQTAINAAAWKRAQDLEALSRLAYLRWLPRPLRWLIDHPRLLALYLRLPHRSVPYRVELPGGACYFTEGPKP